MSTSNKYQEKNIINEVVNGSNTLNESKFKTKNNNCNDIQQNATENVQKQKINFSKIGPSKITSKIIPKNTNINTNLIEKENIIDKKNVALREGWIYCGKYYLNVSPQGTEEWLNMRKYRIPASKYNTAAGRCQYKGQTQENLWRILNNEEEEIFDEKSKIRMAHGTAQEPEARQYYEKTRNCKVKEIGFAVPTWDFGIGGSVDGIVLDQDGNETDILIEIKSPKKMYPDILAYLKRINDGWKPESHYTDHITESHYDQMQGCMAVTGKKYCDYIVYATDDQQIFIQRIDFNPKYWNNILYPALIDFRYLYPLDESKRIDPIQ